MNNLNGDPLCCGRAARATPEEKKIQSRHIFIGRRGDLVAFSTNK